MNTTTASTTTNDFAAKPARRGRRGLAVVGIGLALATTAPVLAGPLTGVARADTVDPARVELADGYHGSHLNGHLRTIDGAPLRLAGKPSLGEHTHAETELPTRVAAGGKADFSYSSEWGSGAEMTFIYAIGDGTWELWAHTSVPVAGKNTVDGEIRRYGAAQADPDAPYNVTAEFATNSVYNPEPTWTISNKPGQVVTDRVEQANLLTQFCKGGNGSCRYIPKSYVPDVNGTPFVAAGPFYNDTPDENEFTYTKGVTTTWKHTIGVEASAELEIAKVVNIGMKVSYEVTYAVETHDGTEMRAKVAPGHSVEFVYTPVMAKVSGDFTIYAEGTRYDLKDVDFTFPTGQGAYHAVEVNTHH